MLILSLRRWRTRVIPKKNDLHEPPAARGDATHAIPRIGMPIMKPLKLHALAAFAAIALAVPAAHAGEAKDVSAGKALVQQHACFTCHAIEGTKIGPSFTSLAAKFSAMGEDKAEKALDQDVHAGVKGTPMPPNPSLSQAELDQIADWILSLKK